jgi:nitrogenase subunit NifH
MEKTLILLTRGRSNCKTPNTKKTEVYKIVAKEINEQTNYTVTSEQVQNRMKTLNAKFKEVKDHNN